MDSSPGLLARISRETRFPLLKALVAQFVGLVLTFLLVFLIAAATGVRFPLILSALIQGGIAAALSRYWLGMMPWWLPIQFLFMPALVAGLSLDIAPPWFLAGFLLLLAVYWSVFRTQVPLYLSSRAVWRALADLLPAQPEIRLIDLGSGLGGLLGFLARSRPQGHFVGVEAAPLPFALGWLRVRGKNCEMRYGSLWRQDLAGYDVVYAYLSPVPMADLWRKASAEMRPGSLFVSNTFAVPGEIPTQTVQVDDFHASTLYVYTLHRHNLPIYPSSGGRAAALQIACVDGHTAQFAPCIASRETRLNRQTVTRQGTPVTISKMNVNFRTDAAP